jgi:hypothetical protein
MHGTLLALTAHLLGIAGSGQACESGSRDWRIWHHLGMRNSRLQKAAISASLNTYAQLSADNVGDMPP